MLSKAHSKASVYTTIGLVVVTAVMLIMSVHAIYNYSMTKASVIEHMKENTKRSSNSLQQNVSGFMAAYAVNEYEEIVLAEQKSHQYLAIVVEDFNMGKILGKNSSISGKILTRNGLSVDYDENNPEHQKLISESIYSEHFDVTSAAGVKLGSIIIYVSGSKLQAELEEIIISSVVDSIGLSLLLLGALYFGLRRYILLPLSEIDSSIKLLDADGIPAQKIPSVGLTCPL